MKLLCGFFLCGLMVGAAIGAEVEEKKSHGNETKESGVIMEPRGESYDEEVEKKLMDNLSSEIQVETDPDKRGKLEARLVEMKKIRAAYFKEMYARQLASNNFMDQVRSQRGRRGHSNE